MADLLYSSLNLNHLLMIELINKTYSIMNNRETRHTNELISDLEP